MPATIQPKYFIDDGDTEPTEIKNYIPTDYTQFLYSFLYNKEDIISLGVQEEALNSLTQVTINEAIDDSGSEESPTKGLPINKEIFKNTIILSYIEKDEDYSIINTYRADSEDEYIVYKISDDIFFILSYFIPM